MEATKKLMEEHRVIERVLSGLEAAVASLSSGLPVRAGFFLDSADFIEGFADGCHHKKEEGVLFPAMESAGIARQGGPIGVMLSEHEEGRRLTRAMREAAQRLGAGETQAKDALISNAQSYVSLLRQHITKEDRILFPMAEQVLNDTRQAEVSSAFEHIGHEETSSGVYGKYLAVAQALDEESRH
jgi:hemerythrin-like domain-containing protein